jgi:hypothetical protein
VLSRWLWSLSSNHLYGAWESNTYHARPAELSELCGAVSKAWVAHSVAGMVMKHPRDERKGLTT